MEFPAARFVELQVFVRFIPADSRRYNSAINYSSGDSELFCKMLRSSECKFIDAFTSLSPKTILGRAIQSPLLCLWIICFHRVGRACKFMWLFMSQQEIMKDFFYIRIEGEQAASPQFAIFFLSPRRFCDYSSWSFTKWDLNFFGSHELDPHTAWLSSGWAIKFLLIKRDHADDKRVNYSRSLGLRWGKLHSSSLDWKLMVILWGKLWALRQQSC